jgi:hypothetical protein
MTTKVRFPTPPYGAQTFAVARPQVIEVLKHAQAHFWGWHLRFEGTREQLLAAGVADAAMFSNLGKTGVRTDSDDFGTKWTMQRRAAERFELTLRTNYCDGAQDMDSKSFRALKGWREHGAAVDAEVADALERMRRPVSG